MPHRVTKLTLCFLSCLLFLTAFSCAHSQHPGTTRPADSAYRSADSPGKPGYYLYAGLPANVAYPNTLVTLYNEGYVAAYDERRGVPAWVAYRVFPVAEYRTYRRPSRFKADKRTQNRVSHKDYTHSGYDRGHMAPNFAIVTRYGREAQLETFFMTNIAPQAPRLNRQLWRKLEMLIARDYTERFGNVWVITGPVYEKKGAWLKGIVEVPSHFFMIVKAEVDDGLRMLAFLVPQTVSGSEAFGPYLVSVRTLEEKTGFNFNPLLEPTIADPIETTAEKRVWVIDEERAN